MDLVNITVGYGDNKTVIAVKPLKVMNGLALVHTYTQEDGQYVPTTGGYRLYTIVQAHSGVNLFSAKLLKHARIMLERFALIPGVDWTIDDFMKHAPADIRKEAYRVYQAGLKGDYFE